MFFFRVDGNITISYGHIMRCIALADALMDKGEEVCFLVADDNPVSVLSECEKPYIILDSDWKDLSTDVEQVIEILNNDRHPVLLIDTYRIDSEYVEKLKPLCKIAYLGSKKEYLGRLDLLVNYSTDIDREFYRNNYDSNTLLLLGPSYAPLRKEFQKISRKYGDDIKHILITTGNSDNDCVSDKIIKGLLPLINGTDIKLQIVVGRLFPNKSELHELYDDNQCVVLNENVQSMSVLMQGCDLAISANGTTVYELASVGLPIISFAMVEEQIRSAEALSELGVIDYCGRSYENNDCCISRIANRVLYYMNDNKKMIELAQRAHSLIDGNGVYRITEALCSL